MKKYNVITPKWMEVLIVLKNNQDKDSIYEQTKKDVDYVSNIYSIITELEKLGFIIVVPTSGRGNKAIIKDAEVIKFIELYETLVYNKLQQDSLLGDN